MTPLDEMVTLNRTAEKLVQMGLATPKEAYTLAGGLLGVIKSVQAEIAERFPKHVGDITAGNVLHLLRVHSMQPVLDAALAVFEIVDAGRPIADIRGDEVHHLMQAVRNYKLVHMTPAALPAGDAQPPTGE